MTLGTKIGSYAVELSDITESRLSQRIELRYQPAEPTRVQEIALITDIEEILAVGPDTIVLLNDSVSAGGWMVSAALRYAWERRACAVLAPHQAVTEAAVELAQRLNVALISTQDDVTRLGLDIAIQLGMARAGTVARIQAFTDHISHASTLSELARMISRELGGARVRIRVSGAITVDVAVADQQQSRTANADDDAAMLSVDVPQASTDVQIELLGGQVRTQDYAERTLHAAVPIVRALMYQSRLAAVSDSLPIMSMATLIGAAEIGRLDDPGEEIRAASEYVVGARYRSVCILVHNRESLGAAVHQIWQRFVPDVPLISISDGWLAFVPVEKSHAHNLNLADIRAGLSEVNLFGASVGISTQRSGPEELLDGVREAWLAARMAMPGGDGSTNAIEFSNISGHLIERLVPRQLAIRLCERLYAELLEDPAARELVEAVVTFLAAKGSVSKAAELLAVHRNTMQARIRRAEELGVDISNPQSVLSTHMLLASVLRGWDTMEADQRN